MASIARNTAFLSVAKLFNVAIYALFGLVLPRFVSTETNGVYTQISTLLFFGSMAASFGIPLVFVRAVARDRSRAATLFVDARTAMGGGSLIAGLLMLAWVLVEMAVAGAYDPLRVHLALLAAGILLGDALGSVGESLYQSHEEMVFPALVEIATGVLRAGGALLALVVLAPERPEGALPAEFGREALYGVYAAFLAGSLLRGVIVPRLARRRFLPGAVPAPSLARAARLLVDSLGIALFRMLRMVRNRIDVLLLGFLMVAAFPLGLQDTVDKARGLYGQAFRVVVVFHTFTMAFNTAIFPRMARLTQGGVEQGEVRRQFFRAVRYQAWWAAPLAAVTFVYADHVAGWFGADYRDGFPGIGSTTEVLRILVFAMLFDTIGGPVGMLLIGQPEMDRKLPWLGGLLAAVSVGLNLVLIPRYGIAGAAYASLGASSLEIVVKLVLIRRFLGSPAPMLPATIPYLAIAAGLAMLLRAGPLAERAILGGLAMAAAYLVLTVLLRLVDPAVTGRLKRLILRRT